MKSILEKIISGVHLTCEEACNCMLQIGNGELPEAQTVAIMAGLQLRGLQLDELSGFRNALMELALPVALEAEEAIDVCGTGGDGKNTFNVSTTTAFVLAGMGSKVIKHGNYGVSSLCGSSNVLETLGYTFTTDRDELQRQLDKNNICFLHAPLFHPALKRVAPLRKALGVATFFNSMGPLVNPANPSHQLTGTYSLELARQYQHVLRSERKGFAIVHGLEGYDELTFIGATRVLGQQRDEIIALAPGKPIVEASALYGGNSPQEAALILKNILNGKGSSAQNIIVAGNAALAIQAFDPKQTYENAFHNALDFILSGKAAHHLIQN